LGTITNGVSHDLAAAAEIAGCLTRIARYVSAGCRLNPRRKRPNTYQLLLALSDASLS